MVTKVLDCSGMNCPMPVISTRKELAQIKSGILEVIVDNDIAKMNIEKLARNTKMKYQTSQEDNKYRVKLTVEEIETKIEEMVKKGEKFTVVISGDQMGQGSEDLGRILMKGYIFALSECEARPTDLIMYNAGVKNAVEGSVVIESLKKLEKEGVNIQICGTCLDYYEIKDKLLVGEISNMYNIVETMNTSDKVIKI